MKVIDYTKILTRAHEDKWVVISDDFKKVLGYSKNLSRLYKKFGSKKVIYRKVPKRGITYVFAHK